MTLKEIGWFIEKEMMAQDFKMIRFREKCIAITADKRHWRTK